jgi:hypothetical protein
MRPPPLLEPLENRTLPSAANGLLATIDHAGPSPTEDVPPALAKHENSDASEGAAQQPKKDQDQNSDFGSSAQSDKHQQSERAAQNSEEDQDQNSDFGWSAQSDEHRQSESAAQSSLHSSQENDTVRRGDTASRHIRSVSATETTYTSTQDDSLVSMETSGQPLAVSDIAAKNTPSLDSIAPSDKTGGLATVPRMADAVFLDGVQAQLPGPQPELAPAADQNLTPIATELVDTPYARQDTEYTSRSEMESGPSDVFVGLSERVVLSSLVGSLENSRVPRGDKESRGMRSISPTESINTSTQNDSPASMETSGQPLALSAIAAENTLFLDSTAPSDGTVDLAITAPFADGVFFDAWQEGLPAPQPEVAPAADRKLTIIATYLVDAPPAKQATEVPPRRETESGPTDFVVGLPDRPSVPPSPNAADNQTAPPTLPATPYTLPPPQIQTPPAPKADPGDVPPDNGEQSPPDQQTDADPDPGEVPEETGGE